MTNIFKPLAEHICETRRNVFDKFQQIRMYPLRDKFKKFFRKITIFSQKLHRPCKSIITSLLLLKAAGFMLNYLGIASPESLGAIKSAMTFAGTHIKHFWKVRGESIQRILELIERISDLVRDSSENKK